jgi:hypothetical protein
MADTTASPNPFFQPLEYVYQNWAQFQALIVGSPVPIGVIALLVFMVSWLVFRFLHRRALDQIPILENRLVAKDEDIQRLKDSLAAKDRKLTTLKERTK